MSAYIHLCAVIQLFLERERAAILAEAKTDDLISEAPKPALDQSGEWKETSGEIQWVAAEPNDSQAETKEGEKKEEEDEELDLNKGDWLLEGAWLWLGGNWQGLIGLWSRNIIIFSLFKYLLSACMVTDCILN